MGSKDITITCISLLTGLKSSEVKTLTVVPIGCLLARLHLSKPWHLLLRLFLWQQCQTRGLVFVLVPPQPSQNNQNNPYGHTTGQAAPPLSVTLVGICTNFCPASHCWEGEHIQVFLHFSALITRRSFTLGKAKTPTIPALHPEHPSEKVICFKMVIRLNFRNQCTSLLRVWQMAGSHF